MKHSWAIFVYGNIVNLNQTHSRGVCGDFPVFIFILYVVCIYKLFTTFVDNN